MPKAKDDWRPRFIDALIEHWTIREACRESGIPRSSVYFERQSNPDFDAAVRMARTEITERLEHEAYRRAVEGFVEREEFDGEGNVTSRVTKFDARLLELLLKANAPGKYRENVFVENAGTVQHQLSVTVLPDHSPVEVEPQSRRSAAQHLLAAGVLEGTARDAE